MIEDFSIVKKMSITVFFACILCVFIFTNFFLNINFGIFFKFIYNSNPDFGDKITTKVLDFIRKQPVIKIFLKANFTNLM